MNEEQRVLSYDNPQKATDRIGGRRVRLTWRRFRRGVGALLLGLLVLGAMIYGLYGNCIVFRARGNGFGLSFYSVGGTIPPGAFGNISIIVVSAGFLILIFSLISIQIKRYRQNRAKLMVQVLATAMNLNVPLVNFLRDAREGEPRWMRRRLTNLITHLEAGHSLSESVFEVMGELPLRYAALIQCGELNGNLQQVVQRLADQDRQRRESAHFAGGASWAYPLLCVGAAVWILGFMSVYVTPRLSMVMRDFGLKPSGALNTIASLDIAASIAALVMILILLVVIVRTTMGFFVTRSRRAWYKGLLDLLSGWVPGLRGVLMSRDMGDVCDVLADAVALGRPLTQALGIANQPQLHGAVSRRLARWQLTMEEGLDPVDAATAARVSPLLSGMMRSAGPDGAEPALRFVARAYHSRTHWWATLFNATLPLVGTIIVGSLVLWIASTLILSMTDLMDVTSKVSVRP